MPPHSGPPTTRGGPGRLGPERETGDSRKPVDGRRRISLIEELLRRADRFQQHHGAVGFPLAVAQKFGNDQAGAKAALIAYYGLFALFPLLLLFTTILGYVLHGNEKLRRDLIDSALGNFPVIGHQLESQTHGLTGSTFAIVVGSLLLLYGAIGLGLSTQNAMNKVWNIPYVHWPSLLMRYLRGMGVLLLLAMATIGSTVLTGFTSLVSHGWVETILLGASSLLLNFALILVAFMVMTAESLTWRDVALGAALAAVFWQVLQFIGSWYMGRELQHSSETLGFFGVVLALVTWIFLGAQLFLMAAEINVVQRYRLWPRSVTQPPLTRADRDVFERLAHMEVRRPETKIEIRFLPDADRDPLVRDPPAEGRAES